MERNMNELEATSRRAGLLYFVFMVVAIVGEFAMPSFLVRGDAAATARNITADERTYRIDILIGGFTLVLFIFLVVSLYKLLKDVDKSHAMLMVLLVSVGVAFSIANLLNKIAALVLLSGTGTLSAAFTKPQLDALALAFLGFHSSGAAVSTAFWGLWLFPFGILVIRSGFLPRILGMLLLLTGFAYVTSGVTSIVWPEYKQVLSRVMTPLYFGEVPIIFWLLIKGAKIPQEQPPVSSLRSGSTEPLRK
jgi:hypothetical protein